ncbi:YifE like protein [Bibersteinia trehalosi USDA-ARS-USMARC-188]|uniref:Macrodomain Ori protein n=4 Tax=Bibersteinia trehalosi TaxID=47735 RepID=A0A4V7IC57_BIBTR|nr:DUF413 domain-containing protein [Bibersteinia trehalosi]AGH37568.1 YifE like protein [Bibersteinia trehalosi USDA-ARS-USMARC-192]AHG82623.1 YifE like protein [Bibersteinia trehalosi USDA-ARS-USMARC-188]AHG84957.1 YifE like protein [Bibersteinia trehalosi USDA-ARS-USMARC-189]OAQ13775.1 hypothetical protein F480_04935 [Bibersteinia trehalosi Y31]RRN06252.1 DUF413 domain-containing protein [Bibersteinia trehalosi]
MAESFSVTRRFFDDKNYPRGFARHGDYTIRESQNLEQFGQACLALESGERQPATAEEEQFVAVVKGERVAETALEKVWIKYRTLTSKSKRIYTLSGDVSGDVGTGDDSE